MRICPCGSGTAYVDCCGPLLDGQSASTAEALMRSRFTAFATGRADHVYRTWHPRTRIADATLERGITWTRLRIVDTFGGGPGDSTGTVSFEASWESAGSQPRAGVLRETSRFERRAGRWFYVDGDVDGA